MKAVEMVGAGKRYWQLEEQAMLLKSLLPFSRPKRHELWAVRDVDLVIEAGETVGIVGRNGAGKTTLLRMLAGVTRPSAGEVTIRGRVAPLIGVGVGFHPEMSGRENVYVNGMLLGLTKAELDERYDEIVAFAELAEFIDTPVKFYSSGMFMRLGFSVAVHVEPQVLLVDEVLAVGDIAFQLKCFERMRALKASGTTIVIVSHSMHAIRLLCPRALLFRRGGLELDGDTEAVISRHHELLSVDGQSDTSGEAAGGDVEVVRRQLLDEHDQPVNTAHSAQLLQYRVRLRFRRDVDSPQVYFKVLAEDGTVAYGMKSTIGRGYRTFRAGEEVDAEIAFEARLGGGTYRLQVNISDVSGRTSLFSDSGGTLIYLAPPLGSVGIADLTATIAMGDQDLTNHESMLITNVGDE